MADEATDALGFFAVDPRKPTTTAVEGVKELPPMISSVSTRACWTFGPLEICATYSNGVIEFVITLLHHRILSGHLDAKHLSASVGVNLGLAKAAVSLTADFKKGELVAEGEVCIKYVVGKWHCSSFREVILRWPPLPI